MTNKPRTAEMIDVLDKEGKQTGEVLLRPEVHDKGLRHASSWLWLHDGRGNILLQLRSLRTRSNPGKWDISAAGHVTTGDDFIAGAIREAAEEIGLDISRSRLREIDSFPKETASTYDHPHREHIKVFWAQIDPSEVGGLQAEEVSQIKWISADGLEADLENSYDKYVPHPMDHYGMVIDLCRQESRP